tara:strand:+ start:141 stop:392 length:252 start_codon:yes stop_codon:yes gene_type:complete
MTDYNNNNTGVLFRQAEKESDKHPDFTGNCEVNNKKMQLAGWINTSKDGSKKYVSLKFSEFKPKKDASNTNATPKPEFDDIPF